MTELQGDPHHSAEENHEDNGLKPTFWQRFVQVWNIYI